MIIDNPTISGSALLSGSLTITGSLNVSGSISGLASNAVSASYALISTSASYALVATSASQANNADTATSASYALVATSASYSNNSTSASYALNATTSSFALNATTSSFALASTSASYALASTSASYALNATTSSFALASTSASYSNNSDLLDGRDSLTFANTGSNSFVGTQNINGDVAITGSLTTTGAITAQTLNVQQVTSSIVYSSGSNIFGNSISNTQSMTGSVGISGSLNVNGVSTLQGALTGTSATFSGNVIFDTTDRGIVSNTSDGSDNKFVSINGGGARGSDRGGTINLFGNEATGTGRIDVNAGDVVGGVINLVTAGLNRLTVDRAGLVGIGTTSPQSALSFPTASHIGLATTDASDNGYLSIGGGGGGGDTRGAGMYMSGNERTTYGGQLAIFAGNVATSGFINFNTGGSERMRITSGGTVLVGATDPDVGGSVKGAAIRGDGSIVGATNISSPVHYQSPITADRMNTMGDGVMYGMWRQGIFQAGIGATNGSVMTFFTGNNSSMTECMRINSSSNVLIGTTSDVSAKIYIVGSASYGIVYQNASNVNNFYVGVGGDGYLRAASWSYGSDRRIKENISYIETGLNKVLALKPATFDYIDGIKNNIGWIAQDVQEVIPEAIGTISKTNDQLTLKSDFIIPYLVKAIQEQQAQIESQQAQITELQNK